MPDMVLIFSLGPVQGFLKEARRAQDLWAGSQWLSDMARAALQACLSKGAKPIYPANPAQESLPNKFVVRVPKEALDATVKATRKAAHGELERRAQEAKAFLRDTGVPTDGLWEDIWQRQLAHHLETFWSAAEITGGDYRSAYQRANLAFEAAKRTRAFQQVEEDHLKDSLSGRRSALHTAGKAAREYWKAVGRSPKVTPAKLKPDGRERLDALGATKRFGFPEAERFPSVSTVASVDFLERVKGSPALQAYRQTLNSIPLLYRVRDDKDWPYDGDLLYEETLIPQRLQSGYGFSEADLQQYASRLEAARSVLKDLYRQAEGKPNPYYAILVMDGDDMGKRVSQCASEEEHAVLSAQLVTFAGQARQIVQKYQGYTVYAGGDDVLALLPVSKALPAVQDLTKEFSQKVPGATASAGISVAHHLYPLDAALQAAHDAEHKAKAVDGKEAVCVRVLKRSGEPTEVRSHWSDVDGRFEALRAWFSSGALSSRLAYEAATNIPILEGELLRSELKRLIQRHSDEKKPQVPDAQDLARELSAWAENLPGGGEELSGWLLLARFVAQGGGT
ncbi:MAG: type III-B CRISPR-associated protein Cas10/Cmr2 [Anaerolineae bacterium]